MGTENRRAHHGSVARAFSLLRSRSNSVAAAPRGGRKIRESQDTSKLGQFREGDDDEDRDEDEVVDRDNKGDLKPTAPAVGPRRQSIRKVSTSLPIHQEQKSSPTLSVIGALARGPRQGVLFGSDHTPISMDLLNRKMSFVDEPVSNRFVLFFTLHGSAEFQVFFF